MVFKAWLQKKKEQVAEMKRVQRAKQMEDASSRVSKTPMRSPFPPQVWQLKLFAERKLNISIRTDGGGRKSGLETTPAKNAARG